MIEIVLDYLQCGAYRQIKQPQEQAGKDYFLTRFKLDIFGILKGKIYHRKYKNENQRFYIYPKRHTSWLPFHRKHPLRPSNLR